MSNTEGVVFTGTGVTGTQTSGNLTNFDCKGGWFILNLTSASGVVTGVKMSILGVVPSTLGSTNTTYVVATETALHTTTGTYAFQVYPGCASPGNQTVPRSYRVQVIGDAGTYTYTVESSISAS